MRTIPMLVRTMEPCKPYKSRKSKLDRVLGGGWGTNMAVYLKMKQVELNKEHNE